MTQIVENEPRHRYEMHLEDGLVWADYRRDGETLLILHVEAEPQLRGGGAAGQFMQALTDRARADGLKLKPLCSYAAAWLSRHKEAADVLAV